MSPIRPYLTPEERQAEADRARRKHRKRKIIETLAVGGAVGGLALIAIILMVGRLVLAGFMIYWNVTDIINVGPNFWNIFWLVIAAALIFSPTSSK